MTRARWHDFNLTLNAPARWECAEADCDVWGGHGGERKSTNIRRSRADAKAHTEETGHATTVVSIVGTYETAK